MPFSFTTASFPIVKFMFSGKIRTDLEFDDITNLWEIQYEKEKPFSIIFDTRLMKIPNLKYAIKMVQFIGKLKKKRPQYLEKSYIIIRKRAIIRLLDFVEDQHFFSRLGCFSFLKNSLLYKVPSFLLIVSLAK